MTNMDRKAALKTANGTIFMAPTHCQAYNVAEQQGIKSAQIVDWGLLVNGEFVSNVENTLNKQSNYV